VSPCSATLEKMSRGKQPETPEPVDEQALTIYVDGSMRSSPRRGGIGIRFVWVNEQGHEEVWDHALPATPGATNNEMELEAPRDALTLAMGHYAPFELESFHKVVVRTDSLYVHDNLPIAISFWSKNQWTKRGGGAVLNVRDWKQLLTLMRRMRRDHGLTVQFEWKKGKKGLHAKAVDHLAKESSDSPSFGRGRPNVVRKKISSEKVDPGSVRMMGQILQVRIIQAQFLPPPHRSSRYKYEVIDDPSPFTGKVDWAESGETLKAGHTYLVRMNSDQDNARIEELIQEVEEDFGPFIEALQRIGVAATARAAQEVMNKARELPISQPAVKRRLDLLSQEEDGPVQRRRSSGPGRPYLYELKQKD
jgi:ribonuclease HI